MPPLPGEGMCEEQDRHSLLYRRLSSEHVLQVIKTICILIQYTLKSKTIL